MPQASSASSLALAPPSAPGSRVALAHQQWLGLQRQRRQGEQAGAAGEGRTTPGQGGNDAAAAWRQEDPASPRYEPALVGKWLAHFGRGERSVG